MRFRLRCGLAQSPWRMMGRLLLVLSGVGLPAIAGCAGRATFEEPVSVETPMATGDVRVPGRAAWIDTGMTLTAGEAISVVARGRIRARAASRWRHREPVEVGPSGTFQFGDDVAEQSFPLPAAAGGPASCYCLIGRIGDGPPFYIGERKSWEADRSGPLLLGINDFDLSDNSGEFAVSISKPGSLQPVTYEEVVPARDVARVSMANRAVVSASRSAGPGSSRAETPTRPIDNHPADAGRPWPGCSVVVFYVDGLRPDVVREMAAMGHLPNIKRHFLEGGAWMSNAFTAFPSDTITSNGTMWTGCFSDRHGLKGQVRFSRRGLYSESYLEPLGPHRSARLLAPQGIDWLIHEGRAEAVTLVQGKKAGHRWRRYDTSGIMPLYQYLEQRGDDWATGVLPIMSEFPPSLWTRSLMRYLPYLRAHDAWKYIDDANAHYALTRLLDRNSPVTVVWLPETDSVSHHESRGQFGMTRRTIANADVLIGRVVDELRSRGRLQRTYLILVSDHGHHGGRTEYLSQFDLADELFFQPRQRTRDGRWVGGGLGLSVRQHRFRNQHRGDGSKEFVFVDADATGAARIFLPRRHYRSKDWTASYRPADLLSYRIADDLEPIDLVQTLCATRAVSAAGHIEHPIDLVLMRLTDNSILISTADRGAAVIDRKRTPHGEWFYRYTPVDRVQPLESGEVTYRVLLHPQRDPLGLLNHYPTDALRSYYDERIWLNLTLHTRYPDSVVTLTRHMLWQQNLVEREREFAPDLVVTARSNWYFGIHETSGSAHGYPLFDSMRASFFISGPNVRRGARIERPCRLVDLTPTILDMLGIAADADQLDGTPIRGCYESSPTQALLPSRRTDIRLAQAGPELKPPAGRSGSSAVSVMTPVYWHDVDLKGWRPMRYRPLRPYDHLPVTINKPQHPLDLNNIVTDVVTLTDIGVLRLADDALSPLVGRKRPVTKFVDKTDERVRRAQSPSVAEAAVALNVPSVVLGDYSVTSAGNLRRADGAIDWVQHRTQSIDRKLAAPLGRESLPGTPVVHTVVDGMQTGFWNVYTFLQRVVIQILDESLINSIENGTDESINSFRRLPAETIVDEPGRASVR